MQRVQRPVAGEPTINPYAPPVASIDAPASGPADDRFDKPLFSSGQIGAATFFGTLLAGVLLLQANYRVMRRPGDANKALGLGLLAFAALIPILLVAPRGVSTPLNIALTFVMSRLARSRQGEAFFKHTTAGGAKRSGWLVFAVIVAVLAAVFLTAMIVAVASGAPFVD